MDKYLKNLILNYQNESEKIDSKSKMQTLYSQLQIQIGYMQHERLIHLLVTLFFALFALIIFAVALLNSENILLWCEFILLVVLLVPYIFHYRLLENGVQKLYQISDQILKKIDELR